MNGESTPHWHAPGRSDQLVQVMFVLDVTQSMASEIKGVKQSIKEFMAAIREQQLQVEVGLTYFRDIMYPRQHPGVLEFAKGSFTDDAREFIGEMDQLKPWGGGGNPYESSKHAVLITCQESTPGARHFLVLVTDQRPYPDGEGKDPSSRAVVNYLQRAGVDEFYLVVRERWARSYDAITGPMNAKVFFLPEHGRSAEAFGSILADISSGIAAYMTRVR